ncbi:hypothetical protein [Anabaena catenula]|uniref:CRISPR-associated protein n=1 Tax=Anabaena catenula FACHB-362 TaxID=2692877 RepID=A0ABR8J385_9NOST|nr:hypothetical protein [Anabaena catenula]MBD2692128.1 hypothetical protein [Anabaena catenula FACHB-362]
MKTWIVTTGNSDIQLKNNKNWEPFYCELLEKGNTEISYERDIFISVEKDKVTKLYPAPSRVLGIVYEDKINNYVSDLEFPLLDTYCQYFKKKTKLDRIIVLLSDQQRIFQNQQRDKDYCPYWQDTCTLKPILTWYFQDKFKDILTSQFDPERDFLYLQPDSGKGLDHWNETLLLVKNVFNEININNPEIYVSHQAGTPAISSAVQFVSLNKFEKVKFVLSNQYYNIAYNKESKSEAEEVKFESESQSVLQNQSEEVDNKQSEYRRSLQIEKAKQLIISGFPGAALKIIQDVEGISHSRINELEKMVSFFNLHSIERDSKEDFEIPNASQRIVDSLDLIGFFLNQKNYLQGITLLAAAQETFLKTAILNEASKLADTHQGFSVSEFLKWDNEGLYLLSESELRKKLKLSTNQPLDQIKIEILIKLKFPNSNGQIDSRYKKQVPNELKFKTNENFAMIEWLQKLRPDLEIDKTDKTKFKKKLWENLIWSCSYYKNREDDLRNQLMHNLRGMKDDDAIKYLLGYPEDKKKQYQGDDDFQKFMNDYNQYIKNCNVKNAYEQYVRQRFLHIMKLLEMPFVTGKLQQKLSKIADSLDEQS